MAGGLNVCYCVFSKISLPIFFHFQGYSGHSPCLQFLFEFWSSKPDCFLTQSLIGEKIIIWSNLDILQCAKLKVALHIMLCRSALLLVLLTEERETIKNVFQKGKSPESGWEILFKNALQFWGTREALRMSLSLDPKFLIQVLISLNCELLQGRDHVLAIFVSSGHSTWEHSVHIC